MTRVENDKVLSELMTFFMDLDGITFVRIEPRGVFFYILPAVINLASPKGEIEVDDWICLHLLTEQQESGLIGDKSKKRTIPKYCDS
jgi:hypothetical protein